MKSSDSALRRFLNLGCGSRFHPDWTNIDFTAYGDSVQAYDLHKGIPFPDNTFDVVYHSHLLEHYSRREARVFLRECHRVLKSGGIIRVVVPDLEQIARIYLRALERAMKGDNKWQHHYDWMMLELYDQAVRDRPGGEMGTYLQQFPIPNQAFVRQRLGSRAEQIIQAFHKKADEKEKRPSRVKTFFNPLDFLYLIRIKLIKTLLGKDDYRAWRVGRFRSGGEVHKWMYDRYSLTRLLWQAGFTNPVSRTSLESAIDNWAQFNLDTEADGIVYKPDSLYLEAIKPVK